MKRFSSLLVPAALATVLAACSTSEDYLPPAYTCDCGTLVLDGDSMEVLGAEFVYLPGEDSLFTRRYFVTADAKTDGELKEHAVSLTLDVLNVQSAPSSTRLTGYSPRSTRPTSTWPSTRRRPTGSRTVWPA